MRNWRAALVCVLMGGACAEEPAPRTSSPPSYLYVPNHGSDTVSAWAIDEESGRLDPVPGAPFELGVNPRAAAADARGRILVVLSGDKKRVLWTYMIDRASGRLTAAPRAPFDAPDEAVALAVAPSGHAVYVLHGYRNEWDVRISGFSVDPATGDLAPLSGSPFPLTRASVSDLRCLTYPAPIRFDNTGTRLYVGLGCYIESGVATLDVDPATGTLLPVTWVSLGRHSPTAAALHPTGRWLFVALEREIEPYRWEHALDVYAADRAEGLALVPGARRGLDEPAGLGLHPSGGWLYLWGTTSAKLTTYQIQKQGDSLGALQPMTAAFDGPVRHIAFHPARRFAYVLLKQRESSRQSRIEPCGVDQETGALDPIPGATVFPDLDPRSPIVVRTEPDSPR